MITTQSLKKEKDTLWIKLFKNYFLEDRIVNFSLEGKIFKAIVFSSAFNHCIFPSPNLDLSSTASIQWNQSNHFFPTWFSLRCHYFSSFSTSSQLHYQQWTSFPMIIIYLLFENQTMEKETAGVDFMNSNPTLMHHARCDIHKYFVTKRNNK